MKLLPLSLILIIILFCVSSLNAEKLGYALSGGGARGFAHIGVLKVLEEEGLKPDCISGSSIGAIIGGMYAMGLSIAEIESLCVQLDWNELTRDVHNRHDLYIGQKRWAPNGNAVFELNDAWVPQLPSSVFVGNKINLELFKLFAPASQVQSFSQLPIPFASNATNLVTGEPTTFASGSLMQAIRASMSIPSLVRPFEVDGQTFIDGGVSQNMPVDLLTKMGADRVVGIKVNSSLRSNESLNSWVDVLDQTINIGITRNLNEHIKDCDLLIEPPLTEYSARDFDHIKEIITAGEQAARANIAAIRAFKASLTLSESGTRVNFDSQLNNFRIYAIKVVGNQYLSTAKVKEYLGLLPSKAYSTDEIYAACQKAWNSQAFSTLYPVLEKQDDDSYLLTIHVKELDRRNLALNLTYNGEDNMVAGAVLGMNNYFLKNSKLLVEVKLGGKNELNVDYVKNFGEEWGAYYRVFPYVNEKIIYNYVDHHKTNSVNSLEWGLTSGLGVYAKDLAIAEFFLYGDQTRLYDDISASPSLPKQSIISGFGVKAYHESLDDYLFPSRGARIMTKFNFARNVQLSDFIYSTFRGKAELYLPLRKWISLGMCINYGSNFNAPGDDYLDPFYFGGAEGFMGYSRYEMSAPHYQITGLGVNTRPWKNWVAAVGVQGLRYSDSDIWGIQKDWEYCVDASIGYDSKFMPLKLSIAINEAKDINTFISVGYDIDMFSFSRK